MAERKTQTSQTQKTPTQATAQSVDEAAATAEPRQGNEEKYAAVEASTLEAGPADQLTAHGANFYNPALVGSGTILPDGTYGAPLPDPNLERMKDAAQESDTTQ